MAAGWVKLYRESVDHAVFQDEWVWRLWCWCLLKANHSESQYRGQAVRCGQFITGRLSAADELKVSPSKWYRGMQRLSDLGGIAMEANSNWTTVTICNWQAYQDSATSSRTAGDTTSEQPVIQPANTIKELKNLRTEENTNTPLIPHGGGDKNGEAIVKPRKPKPLTQRTPEFERWYAVYPKRVGPEQAAKAFKKIMPLLESRHPDRGTAVDWLIQITGDFAVSPKGRGAFCWHPATFLSQGHFDDDQHQWQRGDGGDKAISSGPGQVHPDDHKGF